MDKVLYKNTNFNLNDSSTLSKLPFKIKAINGKDQIFDPFRKTWVVLTPEEWVRQNLLQYLVQTLHYPSSLIAVEKEIKLGELSKRFDIVVYKNELAWMIIECKEAKVALNEKRWNKFYNTNKF